MKALSLSNFIINRAEALEKNITNLKLQKILYYIQGYSFKVFDKAAFEDEIVNWAFGATVPEVYFRYSMYGSNCLKIQVNTGSLFISSDTRKLYNVIIDKCLNMRTKDIVSSMLEEYPCKNNKLEKEIPEKDMKFFFLNNDPLDIMKVLRYSIE